MSFRLIRSAFWRSLNRHEAMTCPLCWAKCQLYRRSLNRGMIRALLYMYRESLNRPDGLVLISKYVIGKDDALSLHHCEYTKLQHWGLTDHLGTVEGAAAWHITALGVMFITMPATVTVPKYVYLIHDIVTRREGPEINIYQAYQEQFDLESVLRRPESTTQD